MGYIKHHAIIVTTWSPERMKTLTDYLDGTTARYSAQDKASTNGYLSAILFPDGSKEGWTDSDIDDDIRDELVGWLKSQCHEDGSSWFEWAEFGYGNDPGFAEVERSSWPKP